MQNLQLWEPSATIEAEGLQKYVSFGSGKGMLVCWQILVINLVQTKLKNTILYSVY